MRTATLPAPAESAVAGNLPPGKYQFVSSPAAGAGSVVVAGSFVPRSASVSFGYDLASDHNVWTDDGVTRVTETLAPSGRVLRRIVAPTGGTVGATEDVTYGYDDGGDSPAYSKPTSGGSLTTYLGDAVDTAGVVTYRHFNAHGDVIGTSTIAGVFTERPAPDEYGLETVAPTDRMGWLGKQQRMQTGINNYTRMGVRLYDPATGRFLSVDPVDGGSANNYDYVAGDPANNLDLGGTDLCFRCVGKSLGGVVKATTRVVSGGAGRHVLRLAKGLSRADLALSAYDALRGRWRHALVSVVAGVAVGTVCGAGVVAAAGTAGAATPGAVFGCTMAGAVAGQWLSSKVNNTKRGKPQRVQPTKKRSTGW